MSATEILLSQPGSKARILQDAALKALLRHEDAGELPTTRRFLFYELEQAGVVSKNGNGARRPDQDLQDAVTRLCEAGIVPWGWLVDEERSLDGPGHLAWTAAAWARDLIAGADLLDPWLGPLRPLVITESKGIQGVLRRTVCGEYRCEVASTKGQSRGFLETVVGPCIAEGHRHVLYMGDHDLAGNQIEAHTRRVLERHAPSLAWERLALTDGQVADLGAKGVQPIKKKDRRYKDGRPHDAYECEAIGQGFLMAILRERLDELLPEPLADVLEREEAERATVLTMLGAS